MKKYISLWIIWLSFGVLSAQTLPGVSIKADTTQIRIGEQIKLSVQAKADTLSFVDFPELSELGQMEVVTSTPVDTLQQKPFRFLRKDYFITQWDSGQYVVPPIAIRINDSIFHTDSLTVQVKPVVVDTTKQGLFGLKPLVNVAGKPVNEVSSGFNYAWLLLLLPLLAILYYLYKRRQQKLAEQKSLTPYQIASQALQKLWHQKLWLQNQVDEHYFKLTEILKNYIENNLGLSAKEKISSQIIQDLQKYRFENGTYIDPELLKRLQQMFSRADLAKFAKLTPDPATIDLDFNIVKDFITTTNAVVQQIADEKAAELAAIEAAKAKKKRIAYTVTAVIIFLVLALGGAGYYYLNKYNLINNIKENVAAPEWVYNEYGGTPSLGLTTPHILHSLDVSATIDTLSPQLKQLIDEMSFYKDDNLIKKYLILEGNMDFKQKIPTDAPVMESIISGMLQQMKAREVNMQQADIDGGKRFFGTFVVDIPVIGQNVKVAFDSRFYQFDTGIRFVTGMYLEGNKENEALIDRVLQSAELVK